MKRLIGILCLCLTFFYSFPVFAYDKSTVDITSLSILEIQENIDKGYLTYEKLMQLYLDRIDAYEDQYNALISVNEKALEEARKCDQLYQKEGRKGLLFGIPVILKDNIDYTGLPTTAGTKALKDSIPNTNAKITQSLVDQGAIILAKANMSEFAFRASNSYSSYGSVKNAYDLLYSPYGSSGGSAVSVAARFAPLAIGTDTNSSVRLPASANHVVGLRPTYGLLSRDGIIAYDVARDTAGPMSTTVVDNAILMTVLANNGIDYTKALKKEGLTGKKIGVLRQFYEKKTSSLDLLSGYYDELERLMKEAIVAMEASGATIIYLDDFYNWDMESYYEKTLFGAGLCYQFNQYIKNTSSKIKSFNQLLNNGGYIQNLSEYDYYCTTDLTKTSSYQDVLRNQKSYQELVKKKMSDAGVDVLVYPNSKNKLLQLNENASNLVNTTYPISPTTGFPAISVPLGFDQEQLPYGIEFLALPNQEELLYEVAYAYEQVHVEEKVPDIAASLYEVPSEISGLKTVYEENPIDLNHYSKKKVEAFKPTYEAVKEVLFNYNEYEGTEEEIKTLHSQYQEAIKELNRKSIGTVLLLIVGSIFVGFVLLLLYRRHQIQKRRRKRHKRKTTIRI